VIVEVIEKIILEDTISFHYICSNGPWWFWNF